MRRERCGSRGGTNTVTGFWPPGGSPRSETWGSAWYEQEKHKQLNKVLEPRIFCREEVRAPADEVLEVIARAPRRAEFHDSVGARKLPIADVAH